VRTTIGVAVSTGHVRAVMVRGGRVLAASEVQTDTGESLVGTVQDLLRGLPVRRFGRPRVVAALGPADAQVRRITGLPPVGHARTLDRLVRESAGTFFLRNGRPLVISGIRVEAPGVVWAAALDQERVREIEAGCRAAALRLEMAIPSAVALPHALGSDSLIWKDGEVGLEIQAGPARTLASVRRLPLRALSRDPEELEPVPFLGELGEKALAFADAYGAAMVPAAEPLVHRPAQAGRAGGSVPVWRTAVAAIAALAALAGALLAPGLRARQAEAAAQAELGTLQEERRAVATAARELERVTAALAEVERFAAGRRSPTLLLAELARTLPEGVALVSLQLDSVSGSLVALSPRASAVLPPLERVSGIASPEIVGPVTREVAAGRQVERVTVRFRLTGGDAASRAGGRP
jgi:hypothetical protein